MLIRTQAICDKHKVDLEPFYLWGKTFYVCPHCTGAKKKSPRCAFNTPKHIQKQMRQDKAFIDKSVWKSKGKIYQSKIVSDKKKAIANLKRHNREMNKLNYPVPFQKDI